MSGRVSGLTLMTTGAEGVGGAGGVSVGGLVAAGGLGVAGGSGNVACGSGKGGRGSDKRSRMRRTWKLLHNLMSFHR